MLIDANKMELKYQLYNQDEISFEKQKRFPNEQRKLQTKKMKGESQQIKSPYVSIINFQ